MIRVGLVAWLACLLPGGCTPVADYPGGVLQDETDLAVTAIVDLASDDDAGYVSPRRDGLGDGLVDLAMAARDLSAGGADLSGPPVDDAVCDACEQQKCRNVDGNDWYAYCFLDDTTITDGPGAGKKWSQLCLETLQCARQTGCAAHDPQACYCGDGVSDTTCLASPMGPCRDQFEAAAETTHVSDVVDRLADPSYPVGAAFNLLRYCEIPLCGASCTSGGAHGDGGGTTPVDLATTHDLATPPDLVVVTLLANPGFDSGISGWSAEYGATAAWQPPPDALGSTTSGSILVTNTTVADASGTSMAGAAQCVPATGGASYRVSASARIASGQGAGTAQLAVQLFASSDCSDTALAAAMSSSLQTAGAWTMLSGSVTAPATAHSLRVRLVALKQFRDAPFAAQFDNAMLETP
jgi:hypothetical protein